MCLSFHGTESSGGKTRSSGRFIKQEMKNSFIEYFCFVFPALMLPMKITLWEDL